MADEKLTLVVLLWIAPGSGAEFNEFEMAASRIMRLHGGRIERRIVSGLRRAEDQPDEIHIVTFPDEAAFERYRADEQLLPLQSLRGAALERSVVWHGSEFEPWIGGRTEG